MKQKLRTIESRFFIALSVMVLGLSFAMPFASSASATSYPPDRLIDDYVMRNANAMSQPAIQAFLVSKNSSLANYNSYSGRDNATVSAAQIIYEAAQDYGINPQAILATLQKEQSLVTAQNPVSSQYNYAMGYGCPDSTGCSSKYIGFYNQVDNGTWQFRANMELSSGNSYWGYSPSSYPCNGATRYYSAALKPGSGVTFYDDRGTPYSSFTIGNAATAALYCYTPHVYPGSAQQYYSGSQNFEEAFTQWGWSLYSDKCNLNTPGSLVVNPVFHKTSRNLDTADLNAYSGTSTNCIESHIWNPGMQSWQTHIASNQQVVNYPDVQLLYGDLDGSGYDYPVLFGVRNTSTGMIESHVWNRDMKSWLAHAASNQPTVDPGDCKLLMADFDGDGKDSVDLVCERNTSTGMIEIHQWNPGMQTWAWHTVTNMPAIDPSQDTVLAGDINGDGKDELILVAYNHTGSGRVEFHVWNPGFGSWQAHIASNQPEVDQNYANIQFADIDGNGTDEAVLVAYKATGSGKFEFHVWNPGFTSWRSHIASNMPLPN